MESNEQIWYMCTEDQCLLLATQYKWINMDNKVCHIYAIHFIALFLRLHLRHHNIFNAQTVHD